MPSANGVYLLGNCTRDLELRYTPGGVAVTTIGLAVNEKRGKGDDAKEETLFIDCAVFGKTAEACVTYLSKGSPVFIEGRLKLRTWEQDGQKRSKIEVTAHSVQFLSSGKGKPSDTQGDDFSPPDDEEIPF